jgi:hypothetical protein
MEAPGSGQLESVAAFVGSLGPGSVCFVRGEQASQQLAANLCEEGNPVVIQDADDVNRLGPPKSVAGVFVVLLEDPSTALGWLLRRVEEGARVIVNTTARTPQGSKRVLLGINSGVRAEAWLNSHRVFWIGPHDEGGWRCVPIRRY